MNTTQCVTDHLKEETCVFVCERERPGSIRADGEHQTALSRPWRRLCLSLSDRPAAQKRSFASEALWKRVSVQTHTSLYVPAKADEDKQLNRTWCCEWKDQQYIIYLFNAKHDLCVHIWQSYWSESQSHIISISELRVPSNLKPSEREITVWSG